MIIHKSSWRCRKCNELNKPCVHKMKTIRMSQSCRVKRGDNFLQYEERMYA